MALHSVKDGMKTTLEKGEATCSGVETGDDVGGVDLSDSNPATVLLSEILTRVMAIPTYDVLKTFGFDAWVVQNAHDTLFEFSRYLDDLYRNPILRNEVLGRLFHDQNNVLAALTGALAIINMTRMTNGKPVLDRLEKLRRILDPGRELLIRNCRTSMAFVTGNYSMREVYLREALFSGVDRVAENYGYEVVDGDKDTPLTTGLVVIDVSPGLSANVDPDLMSIAMDNLIGNPMRMARDNGDDRVGIKVSVRLTAYDCIQITVTDKGGGLGYYGLYEKYVADARGKLDRGEELSSFDWMMLRRTFSHRDLVAKLFEKGVSMSGSTGEGLSTVKTIVFAHGGDVEMGNNEDGVGATIRILIPDTKSDDPALRAKLLTNARIAMGLNS